MASVTRKRIVAGSQLTTSAATYYTVPAGTRTQITALTLTNTTAGAVTATVNLGTAAAGNTVLSARSLSAGESYSVLGAIGQVMEAGELLQALANANTSISIVASGIEFVG